MTPECQAGTGSSLMLKWNKGLNPCDGVALPSNVAGRGMKSIPHWRQECPSPLHASRHLFLLLSPSCSCFLLWLPLSLTSLSLSVSFLLKPPFSPCSEKSLTTASVRLHFSLKCISVAFNMNKYSFCKIIDHGEDWNYLVTIADKANVDWMLAMCQTLYEITFLTHLT